jgi:hypothetical protein
MHQMGLGAALVANRFSSQGNRSMHEPEAQIENSS